MPDSGGKQNDALGPVVLKLDMHCEGCVKQIKSVVRHMKHVEDVQVDVLGNRLTVFGKKVKSDLVRDKLIDKLKRKVEIISPQPKKDSGAASKPPEKKVEEKKPEVKKTEENPPKQGTVVLKIRLHCDGCIQKIKKVILKFKGVESVDIDGGEDLVTVNGKMEVKELVAYLDEKLNRKVEVISQKKEGQKKEDKKEEKEKGKEKEKKKEKKEGGGGDAKKDVGEIVEGITKIEVNRMEHYGYGYPASPMHYGYDGYASGQSSTTSFGGGGGYTVGVHSGYDGNYGNYHGQYHNGYDGNYGNYHGQGYMVQQPQPSYYSNPYHPPPQMFSDENPNSCSVM